MNLHDDQKQVLENYYKLRNYSKPVRPTKIVLIRSTNLVRIPFPFLNASPLIFDVSFSQNLEYRRLNHCHYLLQFQMMYVFFRLS